jgi:pimeloyl-ACP methyl ester carboxylesterase
VSELDPAAFPVERATVRDGLEIAYVRANPGGFPLLLVHGWPETMRIWWRNVAALAEAGFEVIVPDLRGFGLSGLAPDEHYDMAASATDLHALVHDQLGHERCAAVGGDYGGVVVQDMALRFEGFVVRQCLFNTVLPLLPEAYTEAGIAAEPPRRSRMAADYFVRQGSDADGLAAELDTPAKRRGYVAQMYGPRFWAAPGAFGPQDVDFMTEPFADADKLRASFGLYESTMGNRPVSEPPRFLEPNPVETLVLYGPEDHVIWPDFPARAEVAFPRRVGPFVVPGAGHFLQWERADVLNGALVAFLRDLLPG